jgi:hypothetical protein
MRNRRLHDALRDFALDAASHLTSELRAGHEIPFDLMEEPRRRGRGGPALYHYTPLTSQFIEGRWEALRTLPAFTPACQALGAGAEAYLRVQGVTGAPDPEPALKAMLELLYEDVTNFEFPEDRFERVYGDVERSLYEDTMRAAVVVPLPGMRLESDRVELAPGVSLVAGETWDAPAEAVWGDYGPNVLCVLERDVGSGDPLPIEEAQARFEWLLGALRLYKSGGIALEPIAWARADQGAWRTHPLRVAGGAVRGAPWTLAHAEEDELREFLDLLAESPRSGRVTWALGRFEMGCGRAGDIDALSDYLLAIRSLLDGMDVAGRAALTMRIAALCADEAHRKSLQSRFELAFAFEDFAMAGGDAEDYVERSGGVSPRALVLEVEENLRALLRDVVCGFLEPDLKGAADDILLASGEPIEIHARDLRATTAAREHAPPQAAAPPPPPPPPEATQRRGPTDAALAHAAVASHAVARPAEARRIPEPEADEPLRLELRDPAARDAAWELDVRESGVTHSADWDLDEDAGSYAGPV